MLVVNHRAIHDVVHRRGKRIGLFGSVPLYPGIHRLVGYMPFHSGGSVAHGAGVEMSRGQIEVDPAEKYQQRDDDSQDKSAHIPPPYPAGAEFIILRSE